MGEPRAETWEELAPYHGHFKTALVVAKFLADSGLLYCSRATLRALLPTGRTMRTSSRPDIRNQGDRIRNRTSIEFGDALREMEERGLIQRGSVFVKVVSPSKVRKLASLADFGDERTGSIAAAVSRVREEIAAEQAPKIIELRLAELKALERLMIDARGANWSGRSSVRFVPHGKTL